MNRDYAILMATGRSSEPTTLHGDGRKVKDAAANGCFLAGITRSRVIALLRGAGVRVEEATLSVDDVLAADEVFLTGNFSKVLPISRVEEREYPEGPMAQLARKLYFEFAEREGRRRAA